MYHLRSWDRVAIIGSLMLAVAAVIQSIIVGVRCGLALVCEICRVTVLRGVARLRLCDTALRSTG